MQVSCKVIKSFFRNLSVNIPLGENFQLIFYKFRMTKYDTKLCRVKGRRFMTSSSFINEKHDRDCKINLKAIRLHNDMT